MPPRRNVTSKFLREFLNGRKKLFKIREIIRVKKIWSFKESTISKVLNGYPKLNDATYYLPEINNLQKLDKEYTFNVR